MSKKEAKDKHFLKQPYYKGGKSAMDLLIKQALTYPEEAQKQRIQGSVYLKYSINYKGNVVDVKVLSGLGYGCDEEAARLVRLLKFEIPKIPRKMKVLFFKNIRIHFRLPKQKKQTINYSITSKKSPTKPSSSSNGYSYEISW